MKVSKNVLRILLLLAGLGLIIGSLKILLTHEALQPPPAECTDLQGIAAAQKHCGGILQSFVQVIVIISTVPGIICGGVTIVMGVMVNRLFSKRISSSLVFFLAIGSAITALVQANLFLVPSVFFLLFCSWYFAAVANSTSSPSLPSAAASTDQYEAN